MKSLEGTRDQSNLMDSRYKFPMLCSSQHTTTIIQLIIFVSAFGRAVFSLFNRPPKEQDKGDNYKDRENYPWTIECFLEDLFLGGQSSIILVNRRLSVKFLPDI